MRQQKENYRGVAFELVATNQKENISKFLCIQHCGNFDYLSLIIYSPIMQSRC